MFSAFQS